MMAKLVNRRSILIGMAVTPLAARVSAAQSGTLPDMQVYKDASCGCCGGWIAHMRQAGFTTASKDMPDMEAVKKRHGVPENLYSCHTALIGGYVIEGHVPAAAMRRLLSEKPDIAGLSAPGMPAGSPGMEMPDGSVELYDIVAFGRDGQYRFSRFRGQREV